MKFFGALLKQSKDDPDPEGYQCVNRTENQTEIEYDEEIFCFLKSVPTCSKVSNFKKSRKPFSLSQILANPSQPEF